MCWFSPDYLFTDWTENPKHRVISYLIKRWELICAETNTDSPLDQAFLEPHGYHLCPVEDKNKNND